MSVQVIKVYLSTQLQEQLVGTLAYRDKNIYFEYDPIFLTSNIELSPYKLPLKSGVMVCDDTVFDGLFGVFADSLPDGWGKLLLDRYFLKEGVQYSDITPLDRLGYIGNYGVGALSYRPYISDIEQKITQINLDNLASKSMKILNDDSQQDLEKLLLLGGSSAGARPKVMVQIDQDNNIISGTQILQPGYDHYIVKFASHLDPQDIGKNEYLYSLAAKAAKIEMPNTKLLQGKYFAVERFDRIGDTRVHIQSVAGLTHSDFRYPTLDYDDLLSLTLHLTKNVEEQIKMFRLAVFNLFAHNRDDHAKNFSFLLDENNNWKLAPAYDLTFSQGPGGEHSTTYLGEGKNPTQEHLIKLANKHNIKNANNVILEVKSAIDAFKLQTQELNIALDQ
jgi:serine/threonine-protein kinase HipA